MEEKWLIYLRKSRSDDQNQTVEEVLAKHETILQEYAERELGGRIPEENIYREVVSGESIDDREEIKRVLTCIEDPTVTGVLVIEPQRLSRGDLEDCGRLISSFRFTHTLVATPVMVYNLENKMERKFFQDELLRGRDYLEYTKEILWRGRVAAAKRGCYISYRAPFGYNRVKIGRDWTLEPNDDADTVRLIFEWYVKEGLSPGAVARRLNDMGYKSGLGNKWSRETIRIILQNEHYIGRIVFAEFLSTWVIEHGERVQKRVKQAESEVVKAEGKHPGIVPLELFEAAQERRAKNPRVRHDDELVNVFASLLRCEKCGKILTLERKNNEKRWKCADRYLCRTRPQCYKSAKSADVEEAFLYAMTQEVLPDIRRKQKNGDGEAAAIQKRRLANLTKQMEEYRDQEDKQYELLETGKYSQALFDRRNAALRAKMDECEKEIHLTRTSMPKNINYEEMEYKLLDAIATFKDPAASTQKKNYLLRSCISRIDYSATDGGLNKTNIKLHIHLK